jgi:hypothetical protein
VTPEELAVIKARAEQATPGPWYAHKCGKCGQVWVEDAELLLLSMNLAAHDGGYGEPRPREMWEADQVFVAHARADVPALVAEVERLRQIIFNYADHRPKCPATYDMVCNCGFAEALTAPWEREAA